MADIQDQQMSIRNSTRKKTAAVPQQREEQLVTDSQIFTRNSTRKNVVKVPHAQQWELQPMDNGGLPSTSTSSRLRVLASAQRKTRSSGGYSDKSEPQRRLQSAGVGHSSMKGRLGHLKRAVADAHRNSSKSDVSETGPHNSSDDNSNQLMDIEVYLCEKCDRMFCHPEEMLRHSSSCEKL